MVHCGPASTITKGLKLTDVTLLGFSMATGEVTRYIDKYGTTRVRKAVLIGALGPHALDFKVRADPERRHDRHVAALDPRTFRVSAQ